MKGLKSALALILFCHAAFAQQTDSVPATPVSVSPVIQSPLTTFTGESNLDLNNDSLYMPDTVLTGFQVNHPLYRSNPFFQDLGNIGSPYRLFNSKPDWGFALGYAPHDAFLLKQENIQYYNTRVPFTNLYYIQGANEMSMLKACHSRNVTRNWNVTLNFSNLSSPGFQLKQKTKHTSTQLYTWFRTPDHRYQLLASSTWIRSELRNNGGIADDALFEISRGINRQFFVRLDESRNRIKENTYALKQYYRLGKLKPAIADTLIPDSLKIPEYFANVAHSFKAVISKNYHTDNDPNRGFYQDFFDDTLFTSDSLKYYSYENEVSLFTGVAGRQPVRQVQGGNNNLRTHLFRATIMHQFFKVDSKISGSFQNILLKANIHTNTRLNSKLGYKASAGYYLAGYNGGDYRLEAGVSYHSRFFMLSISTLSQLKEADFIIKYYSSNHFRWINDFDKTGTNQLSAELKTFGLRNNASLNLSSSLITGFIYFDANVKPSQWGKTIQLNSARLSKIFQAGNFFLNANVLFQQVSGGNVFRVPELAARGSFYYQHHVFKSAMLMQLGFDANWYSSYYSYSYAPAIRQYYLQGQVKTGNYPWADVYLSGEIKRANFFFKMEHVTQGLFSRKSYAGPHYPMAYRSFMLGIQWRFYD
jgi:hypothetical protein